MGLFNKYNDKRIIEGIRNQDDVILRWLYDNYYLTVRDHVMKNSGSQDDIADVLQEAIIVLYRQVRDNDLSLDTDLKGYFFGIVRNIWNAQLRKNRKSIELTEDIADDRDPEGYSDPLLERVVKRAFEKLKPDQQEVLRLFADGISYEDIAARMNLGSEVYARRKKYLCKEELLDILKEDPEYQEYLRLQK
jgi:RNA polymerase sigma factor (sigma-70 family)